MVYIDFVLKIINQQLVIYHMSMQ